MLGLDGETEARNLFPSRRVVDWYNGSLDNSIKPSDFDLEKINKLVIVGNGNIACDITRMLLKDPKHFSDSDAPEYVLKALRKSNLHLIQMVARRGIAQSAFTIKEIKEIYKLDDVHTYMFKDEVENSLNEASFTEKNVTKGIGRRTDFLLENSTLIESDE